MKRWIDALCDAIDHAYDRTLVVIESAGAVMGVIGRLFWHTPPQAKMVILACVLGVPLNPYGFSWITFKPVKQLTDCVGDLYRDASQLDRASPSQQQFDHIEAGGAQLFTCSENVDPDISNAAFLQQQHARWREGKY